jgi:hypothetical protein
MERYPWNLRREYRNPPTFVKTTSKPSKQRRNRQKADADASSTQVVNRNPLLAYPVLNPFSPLRGVQHTSGFHKLLLTPFYPILKLPITPFKLLFNSFLSPFYPIVKLLLLTALIHNAPQTFPGEEAPKTTWHKLQQDIRQKRSF